MTDIIEPVVNVEPNVSSNVSKRGRKKKIINPIKSKWICTKDIGIFYKYCILLWNDLNTLFFSRNSYTEPNVNEKSENGLS